MDLMKKGVLFTMLSVLVSGFFIISLSAQSELPLDSDVESLSFRIDVLSRFRDSFETFSHRALRTSGYHAIVALGEHVDERTFFDNEQEFKDSLKSCMVNGTHNISSGAYNCSDMNERNVTIPDWLDTVANLSSNNMSLNTTYEIKQLGVRQSFPFFLTVEMNVSYTIGSEFASISRNYTAVDEVTIEGVREPMGGRFLGTDQTRLIKETEMRASDWNKQNLSKFVQNKEYRYHSDAPSIIDRFTGVWDESSCCGIEAVLSSDLDNIPTTGALENSSYIDYMYFYDMATGNSRFGCGEETEDVTVWTINGISGVQMDDLHLANFNVSSDDWTTNCETT